MSTTIKSSPSWSPNRLAATVPPTRTSGIKVEVPTDDEDEVKDIKPPKCPLCQVVYSRDRLPKRLPCDHRLCTECMNKATTVALSSEPLLMLFPNEPIVFCPYRHCGDTFLPDQSVTDQELLRKATTSSSAGRR